MKISVVGLGYIGLPTGAMLAEAGHEVCGFDVNAQLRSRLCAGDIPGTEQPVRELAAKAIAEGRMRVSERIESADAYVICTPTPTIDNRPDLRFVEAAAAAVAAAARPGDLVVLESTVPPGTTERIVGNALRRAGKKPDEFRIAHCPERVIPGNIVYELRHNARVIGGRTADDARYARDLYASFVDGELMLTDCTTAELVKVVENTYRDVNIAFANELALLAEELGVDVWETIELANKHPRVNILRPGPGVGGHCIPVDPHFLSNANPFSTELIQTARRVNERMPHRVVRRVVEYVPGEPAEKKIVLLGAAYKADVDDARESPTQRVEELLRERGYRTCVYDPLVTSFSRPLCASLEEAVAGADALVLMTDHAAFRAVEPGMAGGLMRGRVLIDARRFFDAESWRAAGFTTYVLGARARSSLADLAMA